MRVIYIAGPFTAPTAWEIEQNVRRAEARGLLVAEQTGCVPLIPHTNSRFFHGRCTPEFWYDATLELLRRCDAALFPADWQQSIGCKREFYACDYSTRPAFEQVYDDKLPPQLFWWLGKDVPPAGAT